MEHKVFQTVLRHQKEVCWSLLVVFGKKVGAGIKKSVMGVSALAMKAKMPVCYRHFIQDDSRFIRKVSGDDETRTRDLRRDRPSL